MPAKNAADRVTGYPDTDALTVLGYSVDGDGQTGVIQGPQRRFARLVERAAAEIKLAREEWNAIADVMNGSADLYDYADTDIPPGILIRGNLEDSPGLADKWDVDVDALLKKIKAMSPLHHEAILCAVRWAWRHCDQWDHTKDDWWTPEFRRSGGADTPTVARKKKP